MWAGLDWKASCCAGSTAILACSAAIPQPTTTTPGRSERSVRVVDPDGESKRERENDNQEKLMGRHPRETHRERTEEEERVRERGWDEHVVLAEEAEGCREN